MKFHLPSFLLGYTAGAGSVMLSRHLRPLLVELAASAYRFGDMVMSRTAMKREDLEDLLAEARARARQEADGRSREHARA